MIPTLIFKSLFIAYLVSVVVFIISENRRPTSSFAWMLLFAILPGVGLAIYLLFGRGHKAFIRKHVLNEQTSPPVLGPMLSQTVSEHGSALADFEEYDKTSARIATLVHSNSNSRVTTRNAVDVLQDAEAAYPAMIEAISGARSSIHLHYYSWGADNIGNGLLELLALKVKEGVEVCILYDPIGSWSRLSYRYLRQARKAGINIRPFSSIWDLHTISYRNHRKIAVIDGEVAFTGGLNIGDEHIDPPAGFSRWRDTNIQLRGSAVWSLQAIFLVDWSNATDEELSFARYFPPPSDSFDPDPTVNPGDKMDSGIGRVV
jgi:cardiolipin synthase